MSRCSAHLVKLGAVAAVASAFTLGGAAAAQASCVNDDNSTPCHWTPGGSAPPSQTSPDLIQQAAGLFSVNPTNFSNLYGYKWNGSQFTVCTAGGGNVYPGTTELCSDVNKYQLVHVTVTGGNPGYTWMYFPTS